MKKLAQAAVFSALFLVVVMAHADTLYYGGDTDYFLPGFSYAAENMVTPYSDIRVYSNVAVPTGQTWTVTGFFAQIGNPDSAAFPVPLAAWDIRTGMSSTSQGTEFASGQSTVAGTTAVSLPSTPINGSTPGFLLTVTLSSPVVLSGGQTYWFSLAPEDNNGYNMFVGGTANHNNAVGGPQDNFSLIDDNFILPVITSPELQTWGNDAAEGILGTTNAASTPEPSSLVLLISGIGGFFVRRKLKLNR